MYKTHRTKLNNIEHDIERALSNMISQKIKKADKDINSLITSASNRFHSQNINNSNFFSQNGSFGSSEGQIFNSLASAIQKSLFRNL